MSDVPRGRWGAMIDRFGIRLVPVGYTVRQLVRSGARPSSTDEPAVRL